MSIFRTTLFCLLALHSFSAYAMVATTPDSDFIDNGDGSVTHKLTGLIWQRCAVGQTWSQGTCVGLPQPLSWTAANQLTSDFAGKKDWRLPAISELQTLIERKGAGNAIEDINKQFFPNQPTAAQFWSASSYANLTDSEQKEWPWMIWFGFGYVNPVDEKLMGTSAFARLVRGGEPIDVTRGEYTPSVQFIDNGDGTVTHKVTGLMWQRCALGQTWNGSGCSGAASDFSWGQIQTLNSQFAGKTDWRVPNINELGTIVEFKNFTPAINNGIFPSTPAEYFWSSSPYIAEGTASLYIDFNSGRGGLMFHGLGDVLMKARLVRGERRWYPTADLSQLNALAVNLSNKEYVPTTTSAKFSGGIGVNYSGYQRVLPHLAYQGDVVTVSGLITPDPQHIGQQADIIAVGAVQAVSPVAQVTLPDDCDLQQGSWIWYMNTQRDNQYCSWTELLGQPQNCNIPKSLSAETYWQQWRGNLYELKALDSITLTKDTPVALTVNERGALYKDKINYRNLHICINFGYRLKDGTIVFNRDTINFRTD